MGRNAPCRLLLAASARDPAFARSFAVGLFAKLRIPPAAVADCWSIVPDDHKNQ